MLDVAPPVYSRVSTLVTASTTRVRARCSRRTRSGSAWLLSGTEGSNPACSSGEFAAKGRIDVHRQRSGGTDGSNSVPSSKEFCELSVPERRTDRRERVRRDDRRRQRHFRRAGGTFFGSRAGDRFAGSASSISASGCATAATRLLYAALPPRICAAGIDPSRPACPIAGDQPFALYDPSRRPASPRKDQRLGERPAEVPQLKALLADDPPKRFARDLAAEEEAGFELGPTRLR